MFINKPYPCTNLFCTVSIQGPYSLAYYVIGMKQYNVTGFYKASFYIYTQWQGTLFTTI